MKVIFYPATTIDGYMAHNDGDSDWVNEADDALYQEEIKKAGCCIVGRKTYEQYKEDFDEEGRVTFVCTSNPEESNERVIFVTGTPEEILKQVEEKGFTSTVLSGGGETNGQFAQAACIDEIICSIYPLAFGEGIKLFGEYKVDLKLELLNTKPVVDGIIQNHYKVLKT